MLVSPWGSRQNKKLPLPHDIKKPQASSTVALAYAFLPRAGNPRKETNARIGLTQKPETSESIVCYLGRDVSTLGM